MNLSGRQFLNSLKKRLQPLLKGWAAWYLSRPRRYRFRALDVTVLPGVFHPGIFGSTRVLLDFLDSFPLQGCTLLELGAGNGLISLYAARKGARVTASDLNPVAIKGIEHNARHNGLTLSALHSDLFERIPSGVFDYLLINPPYYPRNPANDAEHAFYCGENFEYFSRLFAQLPAFMAAESRVLMVLSQDCELEKIREMAEAAGLHMEEVHRRWWLWEWNYVFRVLK